MDVEIKFFAALRDATGRTSLRWPLKATVTVGELFEELARTYPQVLPYRSSLLYAVNQAYVPADHILTAGDEVALIPPVSGG